MYTTNSADYERTLRLTRSRTHVALRQRRSHRSLSRTNAPARLTRHQYVATQRRSLSTSRMIIALAAARAIIILHPDQETVSAQNRDARHVGADAVERCACSDVERLPIGIAPGAVCRALRGCDHPQPRSIRLKIHIPVAPLTYRFPSISTFMPSGEPGWG